MNMDNELVVTKSRIDELNQKVFQKPGEDIAEQLKKWLDEGAPAPADEPRPPSREATLPADESVPMTLARALKRIAEAGTRVALLKVRGEDMPVVAKWQSPDDQKAWKDAVMAKDATFNPKPASEPSAA
jgi:hypothetical protein